MHRYEIKNRNGSTVFVDGVRVGPHTTLTASLDPLTAKELSKYGVSLVIVTPPSAPAEEAPPVDVSAPASSAEDIAAVAQELAVEEEAPPEEAAIVEEAIEEAPVAAEETVAEEPVAAEEPVVEEAPVAAEETVAEEPVAEEAPVAQDEIADSAPEATQEESSEDSGRRKKKNKNR